MGYGAVRSVFFFFLTINVFTLQGKMKTMKPPCESDFQTIKLISNGAYG